MASASKRLLLSPLYIFITYIMFSLLLSIFGPLVYSDYNTSGVVIYISAFLILFSLGYKVGTLRTSFDRRILNNLHSQSSRRMRELLMFVKLCILFTFAIKFIEVFALLASGAELSFSNMGEAYNEGYAEYERGSGSYSLSFIVKIFTYTPFLITIILGAYYFSRLNFLYRFYVIFTFVSVFILETLANGKQKQVGDMLIFLICVLILKSNLLSGKVRRKLSRNILFILTLGISLLLVVLHQRYQAIGVDSINVNDKVHHLIKYNTDHVVFSVFGASIGFAVSVFSGYITQGYYGLSLCLDLPFVWTFGVGSSYSTTMLLSKFGGLPLSVENSYPYRAGEMFGWGQTKWHSVFSWLAGDFTFYGALFILFVFAYIYAILWKEAYFYKSPSAILLFVYFTLGILFIPANNQLFHTPESTLSIAMMLIIWMSTRGRYNFVSADSEKFQGR